MQSKKTRMAMKISQNTVVFDTKDTKSSYLVYTTDASGNLVDNFTASLLWDQANNKPYITDAYVYPVVEYTWNTVVVTI